MAQVCEERLDTCNRKEDPTEDIQILDADEVIDCLGRIIGTQDSGIVGCNVDYSCDK